MKNFRTFQLASAFYQSCRHLRLNNTMKNQLARASSSIALNLAEGYGRRTKGDKMKFYTIAMGSLRECQAILYLEIDKNHQIHQLADSLGAHLYKLINSIK